MIMLAPSFQKNDKKANLLIITFSAIVFAAVVLLSRFQLKVDLGFDVHLFAQANALINSLVALILVIALVAVKQKAFTLHRNLMLTAMLLSVLFLVSYICHHLFAGETRFGDLDHNGVLSEEEKTAAGSARIIYYVLLGTHIPLAGIILRDLKVREAIRQQKTIVSIDPQAQAALDAQQIAEALVRGGAEGAIAQSA